MENALKSRQVNKKKNINPVFLALIFGKLASPQVNRNITLTLYIFRLDLLKKTHFNFVKSSSQQNNKILHMTLGEKWVFLYYFMENALKSRQVHKNLPFPDILGIFFLDRICKINQARTPPTEQRAPKHRTTNPTTAQHLQRQLVKPDPVRH